MQYDKAISTDLLNKVADKISIADYLSSIGEYPQKKNGKNWYYLCSVSGEDHASLAVDIEQNYYHCFSCQNGGNLLNLMTTHLGMKFGDAARKILELANISPDSIVIAEPSETVKYLQKLKREHEQKPKQCIRVYEDYADYDKFSKAPAKEWLAEGITADVQRLYDIRTDPLRNRILYPLIDNSGRYITKKQRSTLPMDVLKKLCKPKYIIDGKVGCVDFLVAENVNREAIHRTNEIIVVEGIKSVLKLSGWNIRNAVSSETSCLNKQQIQHIISLHPKSVVIAYDQDKSFDEVRKHLWILPRFTNVSIVIDKNGLLQPKDSPVDEGPEVWRKLYEGRIRIN